MTARIPGPAASPQLGLPKHVGEKTDPNMVIANPPYVNRKVGEAVEQVEQRVDEKLAEIRATLDTAAREAATAQAKEDGNGKSYIPASWVPFLLVGSALSAGTVSTAALMPNDVPRIMLVLGAIGVSTFGPLLAASPGLRKGAPK